MADCTTASVDALTAEAKFGRGEGGGMSLEVSSLCSGGGVIAGEGYAPGARGTRRDGVEVPDVLGPDPDPDPNFSRDSVFWYAEKRPKTPRFASEDNDCCFSSTGVNWAGD